MSQVHCLITEGAIYLWVTNMDDLAGLGVQDLLKLITIKSYMRKFQNHWSISKMVFLKWEKI